MRTPAFDTALLELRLQRVIHRAQVLPVLGRDLGLRTRNVVFRGFSEDDCKSSFQMPVDVADGYL
jgi:hypothetical protein